MNGNDGDGSVETVRVSLRLDKRLVSRLDALANSEGATRTQVVERLLTWATRPGGIRFSGPMEAFMRVLPEYPFQEVDAVLYVEQLR